MHLRICVKLMSVQGWDHVRKYELTVLAISILLKVSEPRLEIPYSSTSFLPLVECLLFSEIVFFSITNNFIHCLSQKYKCNV